MHNGVKSVLKEYYHLLLVLDNLKTALFLLRSHSKNPRQITVVLQFVQVFLNHTLSYTLLQYTALPYTMHYRTTEYHTLGQLISKGDWRAIDSTKKTD